MKQKHIKDAIEAWNSKEYTLAAKNLYEQMKEEYRVRWVTDILEVCHRMLEKIEEIEEIHILAHDKSKWVNAREAFDRIRALKLAVYKVGKHDSVYERVLDLLENACKVIYNASGECPQFDKNAGWRIGRNIAELMEIVDDKNFREEIWKAFICEKYQGSH